jgi:hypothetical protein
VETAAEAADRARRSPGREDLFSSAFGKSAFADLVVSGLEANRRLATSG